MQSETGSSPVGDGARIAWTRWQGSSAETLVLVHGIGNDRSTWFDIPEQFAAQGHGVLALDLRGHGASSVQPPFGAAQFATDLATLLAERDIVRPVLVGHSLGALVCSMAVAQQLPVRGVVNVDQTLRLTDLAVQMQSAWPALQADFRQTVATLFGAMMPPTLPPDCRAHLAAQYARMSPDVTLSLWAPLAELDAPVLETLVTQVVGGIDCPYLAIHGASAGADYAGWLQQHVRGARFELWDGSGHFPHLVDPRRFVQRVVEFASAVA